MVSIQSQVRLKQCAQSALRALVALILEIILCFIQN